MAIHWRSYRKGLLSDHRIAYDLNSELCLPTPHRGGSAPRLEYRLGVGRRDESTELLSYVEEPPTKKTLAYDTNCISGAQEKLKVCRYVWARERARGERERERVIRRPCTSGPVLHDPQKGHISVDKFLKIIMKRHR